MPPISRSPIRSLARARARLATTLLAGAVGLLGVAPEADAASRSMTGHLTVGAPSAGGIEAGIAVFGKKLGGAGTRTFAPTAGAKVISVAGTTTGTFVGRPVTIAESVLDFSGVASKDFPAFAGVANNTRSFMSHQQFALFQENGGALANCPGPGCTASGAGTAISWCPPLVHNTAAPAPGTAAAQIGNWDCASWPAGAGGGDRFIRLGISNASGRPNFGGTLRLLRTFVVNTWRVLVQPSTAAASDAQVSRSFMNVSDLPWTPGDDRFIYKSTAVSPGPRVFARLDTRGAVQSTFGCTNGVGTVGASFMRGVPFGGAGSNCGTGTGPPPVQGWGFELTTGTVSGSDPYPFGLVVTTVGGTPFNPNFGTQPASQGFFFSRMGTDAVTGTNRNIVLLGGAVAVDPASGNAFFRIMDFRMQMQVPEPASALGLLAGVGGLVAVAARRRRTS